MKEIEEINVVGLGYIGLPTALILASHGISVTGIDYDNKLIEKLNNHICPIKENGMNELFHKAIKSGIKFSKLYVKGNTYLIAVPTPYKSQNKKVDATYLCKAVNEILKVCENGAIIIIESTISPNTIDKVVRPIIMNKGLVCGKDIHLVHAPERIIPGNMIHELENNSRTIGADDKNIGESVKKMYSSFCKGEIIVTDIRTAEMTKVVENTFRDINIAYANELAKICRSDGMDVYEIIRIANKHPRVNILSPGPGVGGHCISVDPWFLVGDYPEIANIILTARKINDDMPEFVLNRIYEIMKEHKLKDASRVGIYGLTYKENVDDLRNSPTMQLLDCMERHLARGIKIYDPLIKDMLVDEQYFSFEQFLDEVDMVVIMVAHDHIKSNLKMLKNKIILDTKNICEEKSVYKL